MLDAGAVSPSSAARYDEPRPYTPPPAPPPPPPPPASDRFDHPPRGCGTTPADPDAPGFQDGKVERGPNGFELGLHGPDPLLEVGGTHDQQEYQRDKLIELSGMAAVSYTTGHTPFTPRFPTDGMVQGVLDGLAPNPPIGADGVDVTRAVYQSHIPNATPQQAYDHFVNNPGQVLSAGGMEIRPPAQRLEDGGRYALEIGGPVPAWLPVEIKLDPAQQAVTIKTLDGHVLRGEQTFTFTDDCQGGTVLTQDARFQASSRLPDELQELANISGGQHRTWQNAHREIYEQFNGDRDYRGLGTHLFSSQQTDTWLEMGGNIVRDPGNAADVGIDSGGEVANWAIDSGGDLLDKVVPFGPPGSESWGQKLDRAGDVVSFGADYVGDRVEGVIDGLNPFD
jgi:hypothetical protein